MFAAAAAANGVLELDPPGPPPENALNAPVAGLMSPEPAPAPAPREDCPNAGWPKADVAVGAVVDDDDDGCAPKALCPKADVVVVVGPGAAAVGVALCPNALGWPKALVLAGVADGCCPKALWPNVDWPKAGLPKADWGVVVGCAVPKALGVVGVPKAETGFAGVPNTEDEAGALPNAEDGAGAPNAEDVVAGAPNAEDVVAGAPNADVELGAPKADVVAGAPNALGLPKAELVDVFPKADTLELEPKAEEGDAPRAEMSTAVPALDAALANS